MTNSFKQLEHRLGYEFNNIELLKLALSHRSVGSDNNERLEFLGDSLLSFFITEALFDQFPSAEEGVLSRLRAQLVKGDTLAEIAREKQLGDYLLLGSGELKSGGFRRASILADAVEAIIAAIFLDSDLGVCRPIVLTWYRSRLDDRLLITLDKDPKTRLQEYMQEKGLPLPVYSVANESGQSHAKLYCVECVLSHVETVFKGTAASKRGAEKSAAHEALVYLGVVAGG